MRRAVPLAVILALIFAGLPAPASAAAGPTVGDVVGTVEDVSQELQGDNLSTGNVTVGDLEMRLDEARSDLGGVDASETSQEDLEALETRLAALRTAVGSRSDDASGDLSIRVQALQNRLQELKAAQATPTPTATKTATETPNPAPSLGTGPEEWEARIGRSAYLLSHSFRDDKFHLRIYSETPAKLMISDAFSGINSNSDTGEIYAEPRTVSRGYTNISFPATTWRGDARITVSGRGGGAFVQKQTSSASLFRGSATWRYVQVAAAAAAATMLAMIVLVAWRRRRRVSEPERII